MSIETNEIQVLGDIDAGPLETSLEISRDEEPTSDANTESNSEESEDVESGNSGEFTEDGSDVHTEDNDEPSGGGEADDDLEKDYSNYSDAQILALSYIEDGTLPEDTDIENLDAISLKEKLLESITPLAQARAEKELKEKYPDEEHFERAKMLFNGATDEEAQYVTTLDQLASLDADLDNEDGDKIREHLITQHYIAKGLDEKKAKKLTDAHFEDGEDIEEAKAAQEYFSQESSKFKRELEEKAEAARQEKKERHEKFISDIKSKVESGELGDIKLSKKEQKTMLSGLLEPTEVYETPDGKAHKVTKYQKKMLEIQNDVDKQLLLAKLILFDDLNASKIMSKAKTSADRDLASLLDGSRTVRPPSGGKTTDNKSSRNIQPLRTVNVG